MYIYQQLSAEQASIGTLIAGIALILSFISTIVALVAVFFQREHDRTSVKPLPDIIRGNYESEIAVKIHNHGMGPMTIEKIEVLSDNQVVANNIRDLMPPLPKNILWADYEKYLEGRKLSPGEEKILINLIGDHKNKSFVDFRNKVRNYLAPLSVKIYYLGLYDKKSRVFEGSLEEFGRNMNQ